jgi:hypothetical protein
MHVIKAKSQIHLVRQSPSLKHISSGYLRFLNVLLNGPMRMKLKNPDTEKQFEPSTRGSYKLAPAMTTFEIDVV